MNALSSSQLSPTDAESPPGAIINSNTCSRCGSISSNKSASSKNVSHHDSCHDGINKEHSLHVDMPSHQYCNGSYAIESDAEQYFSRNASHRSSMHRPSTNMIRYGSLNSLRSRSQASTNGDTTERKHGHHRRAHVPQYHYQQHHTSCKKVSLQGRGNCRHRRKSSSSTLPDSMLHRRTDTDSSSLRGSESCIYEPLHIDVSSPSVGTNTVILTPSKITIERNGNDNMVQDLIRTDLPESSVYSLSPMPNWHYPAPERTDKKASRDIDYIEVLSEPEGGGRDKKDVQKYTYDSRTISVWRTDNEELTNTVILHRESEVVENCCDNYYFHCKAEGEVENCSAEFCDYTSKETECNIDENHCNLAESLNNMMPVSSYPTTPLLNFHKNNISTTAARLDLSPEIRRYSKFTNLQQQNNSNLTPHHFRMLNAGKSNGNVNINQNSENNYFSEEKFVNNASASRDDSHNAQQQSQAQSQSQSQSQSTTHFHSPGTTQINSESSNYLHTNQSDFELFNISSSKLFEKPFGSINLTTQNQFEPFSNQCQNNNEAAGNSQMRQGNNGQTAWHDNNAINSERHRSELELANGDANDADDDNNNFEVITRVESLMNRFRNIGLSGLFREVRKQARKYSHNRKDT